MVSSNRISKFRIWGPKSYTSLPVHNPEELGVCKVKWSAMAMFFVSYLGLFTVDQNIWGWVLFRFWRWYLVDTMPENRTSYCFLLLTISQSGFKARFSVIVMFLQVNGVIWISVDQLLSRQPWVCLYQFVRLFRTSLISKHNHGW